MDLSCIQVGIRDSSYSFIDPTLEYSTRVNVVFLNFSCMTFLSTASDIFMIFLHVHTYTGILFQVILVLVCLSCYNDVAASLQCALRNAANSSNKKNSNFTTSPSNSCMYRNKRGKVLVSNLIPIVNIQLFSSCSFFPSTCQ